MIVRKRHKTFIPATERFLVYFEPQEPDVCWFWTGALTAVGYGTIGGDPEWATGKPRQMLLAHRISYEVHKGPIPEGLHIDHLCRNRNCVNPHHLEAVTNAENNRRGAKATITKEQAAEIKALPDVSRKVFEKWYGCIYYVVALIREGKTWVDIEPASPPPAWAEPFRNLDPRSHRFKDELGKM